MDHQSLTRDDLRIYFSSEDWFSMSEYEKCCCFNRLQNYLELVKLGFPASKPDFIENNVQGAIQTTKSAKYIERKKESEVIELKTKKENEKNLNDKVIVKRENRKAKIKFTPPIMCKTTKLDVNINKMEKQETVNAETITSHKETVITEVKPADSNKENINEKDKLIFTETEKRDAIRLYNLLETALKLCKIYRKRGINVLKKLNEEAVKSKKPKAICTLAKQDKESKSIEKKCIENKINRKRNHSQTIKLKGVKRVKIDKKIKETKENKRKESKQEEEVVKKLCSEEPEPVVGPSLQRRYPKRNVPVRNYTEEEVPDDDDYIFCDTCEREWPGDCPEHGPLIHLADTKIPVDEKDKDRAVKTTPPQLEVSDSEILDGGKGVWTKCAIPPRVLFGPYEGKISSVPDVSGYSWRIMKNRRVSHYMSGENTVCSNWMRFVNSARYEDELNVFAFQYKGQIYYRTFRHIRPKSELKVWYGREYSMKLGITPESFKNPNMELIKNKIFPCEQCCLSFTSPLYLKKHKSHCAGRHGQNKSNYCIEIIKSSEEIERTVGSLSCNFCSYKSARSGDLKEHMKTHTREKPYSCNFCSYKCAQSGNLKRHMKTHTGEKPYSCNFCNYKCARSGDLKDHMKTHTGEKPYSCNFCSYKCAQRGNLEDHMKTHTGEKPFSCNFCSYKSAQSGRLKVHIKTHTGEKPYSCNFCSYKSARSGVLKDHMKTHTGEKPYSCNFCSYKCAQSGHLKRHMKTHTGEKPYSCNFCNYICALSGTLKNHMKRHTGEKQYSCNFCSYKCAQSGNLKRHMKTHTGEKPYSCNFCNYKCARSGDIKDHMKTHTGEKPYSCNFCSYKCAQRGNLKDHMKTHTGEKPFSCNFCSYKSAQSGRLKVHIKTHTGEKPYSCNFCSYKSARSGVLKDHMKTHTGEKPYSCNFCSYKCAQSGHLKRHMKTHTGEKPYSCNFCNYICALSGTLKNHMKRHTGEKQYSCNFCSYKCALIGNFKKHMETHTGK